MAKEEKAEVEKEDAKEQNVKKIVLPGDFIAEKGGKKVWGGAYFEGDKVFSKVLGIPRIKENEISVIPLSGNYIPRINNRVIGVISSVEVSGWMVDINSPYKAFMPVGDAVDEFVDRDRTDISRFFDVGDVIFCKVSKVTKDKTVRVSMKSLGARKLYGGIVIKVTPSKVPRLIGRGGSMINLIKSRTDCIIYTGQNGVVWIRGDNKAKTIEAILTVERESHISGLTEKIEKMLSENNETKGDEDGKD
jgi:exosome complex component RRP4